MHSHITKQRINRLGIILLILVGTFGFLWIRHYIDEKTESQDEGSQNPETTETGIGEQDSPQMQYYDETPVSQDAVFFEKQPVIEGQQAYIAIPLAYNPQNLPTIVIYSHGSDTTITKSLTSDFMLQMREYGEFFAENNYIFAASAMHGTNWGSDQSIADMLKLVDWIKARYSVKDKIALIGFSMGGLPTFKFAFEYPELVSHIASLAGSTKPSTWTVSQIQNLQNIKVRIWHGDKDINVKYATSQKMVDKCLDNGVNAELITIENGTHYDVDWEYHEQILEYFNQ